MRSWKVPAVRARRLRGLKKGINRAARQRKLPREQKSIGYGITWGDYDRMLKLQGGKCAICGRKPRRLRLAIEHNHKTGKVRGLVHQSCNIAIAFYEKYGRKIRAYFHQEEQT